LHIRFWISVISVLFVRFCGGGAFDFLYPHVLIIGWGESNELSSGKAKQKISICWHYTNHIPRAQLEKENIWFAKLNISDFTNKLHGVTSTSCLILKLIEGRINIYRSCIILKYNTSQQSLTDHYWFKVKLAKMC